MILTSSPQRRGRSGDDIVCPGRPPHPIGSPDLAIMRAWVDAVRAGAAPAAVVTAVESAVQRAQDGAARRVLGSHYYRVPQAIRPLLGQPQSEGLKQLLGDWGANGWEPGLAGLTEREAKVYRHRLDGWSSSAIACELTHPEARRDRASWVAVKTVYNLCWIAKSKVLRAFGLPSVSEADENEDWEAEE